jgi:hypothetical protein
MDLAVLYGRVSIMRVKRRLLLQQDTSQTKQSVRDTAQRVDHASDHVAGRRRNGLCS